MAQRAVLYDREVGGGRLLTVDQTDGPGGRGAIHAFTDKDSSERAAYLANLEGYSPPVLFQQGKAKQAFTSWRAAAHLACSRLLEPRESVT